MNIKLLLKRIALLNKYTIGKLYINGEYFCDTLEDTVRYIDLRTGKGKIKGEKAIPYGTYKVILNVSPRFKRILPRLLNVPFFEGILIHSGNTHKDTEGCILVGENKQVGMVLNSKKYEQMLIERLKDAASIEIEII